MQLQKMVVSFSPENNVHYWLGGVDTTASVCIKDKRHKAAASKQARKKQVVVNQTIYCCQNLAATSNEIKMNGNRMDKNEQKRLSSSKFGRSLFYEKTIE